MNIGTIKHPKKTFEAGLRKAAKTSFNFWQKLGVHIVPNHFHGPVPDTSQLDERIWLSKSELSGINMNEEKQLQLLGEFKAEFKNEYDAFPIEKPAASNRFYLTNGMFESVDAEVLYCMIRRFKPKRIIEIGSGYSTLLAAEAILKNQHENNIGCELQAIEPYPNETLTAGFAGLSKLITKKVEDVGFWEFKQLSENDILFIDSSHVLKIGSDVKYEYLEILPSLNKGVVVCVHDIFLPAEYHKEWVLKRHFFWNEQYLLQGFLAFNESFEVLFANSFLHLNYPEKLKEAFASYRKEDCWPGCFWIRRVK